MKPYGIKNERTPDFPIDSLFIKRWSPRAMSGENITKKELMSLFEAARWAPSASNQQPWRFIYALRDTKEWKILYDLLVDFNKLWCKNASALIITLSRTTDEHNKPNNTHSFDTGAAWMSLALQARLINCVAHGMAGFDAKKAIKKLHIPQNYKVEMMIAVGKQGEIKNLDERMQKSEKPNNRKHVREFVNNGTFTPNWK